jgi:hypothetical protein
MNLDEFRNLYKNEGFAERQIKIGTVIRYLANETSPPKWKLRVIIGFTNDNLILATLFINTEVNPNKFPTDELKDLHLLLEQSDYQFLEYDSFLDCSQFFEVSYQEMATLIIDNPTFVIGEISEEHKTHAIEIIRNAPTINLKKKRKFGFLD